MEERPIERRQGVMLDKGEISIVKAAVILVAVLSLGWGVVTTIVLPINSMQVQLAQIQVSLKTSAQNFATLQTQVTANSNDILILKASK